ncbi:MAG: hypothetical protein VX000_06725, partial [Myxococcota bacterium]|nr:hypothetical protein [Myxococcota bacterium]
MGMWLGVSAALMVAAAAALSVRSGPGLGRLAAVLLGVFLAVYGLTGFSVKVAESGFMYAGGLRYAAPLYPLSFLVLATVAGLLWSRGRRLAALVMIAPLLASGLWARVHVLSDAQPLPGRLERDAVDWDYLRERLAWMIPQEGHEAGLQSSDPHTRAVHAYGLAREATTAAVRGGNQAEVPSGCPAGHGVGDALAPDSAAILSGGRSLADLILLGAEADRDCVFERLAVEAIAGGRAEAWVGGALPMDAEAGLGHAAGSAWAARTAGPAPRTVVLPSGVSGPFIAGVGLGLGRRWGPVAAAHPPDGLADEAVGEFLAGVARGVARDWSLG